MAIGGRNESRSTFKGQFNPDCIEGGGGLRWLALKRAAVPPREPYGSAFSTLRAIERGAMVGTHVGPGILQARLD